MKILVICQHYFPEPFRITDICEELVNKGHQVSVVTGTPNYPMGIVYEGYEKGKKMDEVINGVKVHRCITAPRKTGVINRVKNYFSFPAKSKKYIKSIKEEFDVVLVNQLSPVMMAEAGITYKKKHGKKMVLYCLDLWPESLCVGGIKRGSIVYKIFNGISKKIYCSADEILITSKSFKNYLSEKFNIEEERINYLPQYAESQFLYLEEKEQCEDFNLLFAGNIGTAQSVDTIIGAAEILKEENIKFHIVGDGIELDKLKERAKQLDKVIFYGRKPLEEMPKYYQMADAMLVTLIDDEVISLTLPGKVQTYMAAGKPIVGAIDGETSLILQESQGGYCGKAQDSVALAENIKKLISSGQTAEIGKRNREYYNENFSKQTFINKLIDSLEKAKN